MQLITQIKFSFSWCTRFLNKNTSNPQSFVSTGEVSVTNGSLLASGKITGAQLEINDILGTGGVSDAGVLFKRSGNSNEYKFNMSSNNFNIISNDLRSIVVYPNSNVHIGTQQPQQVLTN